MYVCLVKRRFLSEEKELIEKRQKKKKLECQRHNYCFIQLTSELFQQNFFF
jgi:hypothetical protein